MFLYSPEYDTLQVERVFNDARGGDSNPQHILLGGKVGWLGDPVQRVQVTTHTEGEHEPGISPLTYSEKSDFKSLILTFAMSSTLLTI